MNNSESTDSLSPGIDNVSRDRPVVLDAGSSASSSAPTEERADTGGELANLNRRVNAKAPADRAPASATKSGFPWRWILAIALLAGVAFAFISWKKSKRAA